MKLSTYAKKTGICYKTAWNWYKAGRIQGYQSETGTIIVSEPEIPLASQRVAIYARVSSAENKTKPRDSGQITLQHCLKRKADGLKL